MRNNNKGLSLVELIVVVAIMAVLLGVMTLSFSFISGKEAQKCAYNISAALDRAKGYAMAKSGSNEAYLEISKNGSKAYVAQYYVPDNPVKGTTFTMLEEETLGNGRVSIRCVIGGSDCAVDGASKLKISFDRLSGGLKSASVGSVSGDLESITVTYGRKYRLTPAKATGKHTVEKID